jgi:hypothetical protein
VDHRNRSSIFAFVAFSDGKPESTFPENALTEDGMKYNPLKAPEPEEWLAMDESERIRLVEDYHRRAGVRLPDVAAHSAHAAIHAVVESQIALGDEIPVRSTAQRLMAEGLDRHDAIHAIGSVLAGIMHDLSRNPPSDQDQDTNERYFAELQELTARGWLRS